jgi:hypothetical protein
VAVLSARCRNLNLRPTIWQSSKRKTKTGPALSLGRYYAKTTGIGAPRVIHQPVGFVVTVFVLNEPRPIAKTPFHVTRVNFIHVHIAAFRTRLNVRPFSVNELGFFLLFFFFHSLFYRFPIGGYQNFDRRSFPPHTALRVVAPRRPRRRHDYIFERTR